MQMHHAAQILQLGSLGSDDRSAAIASQIAFRLSGHIDKRFAITGNPQEELAGPRPLSITESSAKVSRGHARSLQPAMHSPAGLH